MNGASSIDRLWAATFVIAAASDVLSGAIRYYTSLAGVAPLGYAPKALMLGCIAIGLLKRLRTSHVFVICYLAAQACVSLANGVAPAAVGFMVWTVSPVIFAILMPPAALDVLETDRMRFALVIVLVLCNVGVLLNAFFPMPWIGGSTDVDGVNVQLAVSTYVGTASRLPGFGRSSAGTGLMIGLLTVWLVPRLRSPYWVAAMLALSSVGIWETTNKTTLIALAIVIAFHYLARQPTLRNACIWTTALTFALPLAGWLTTLATNAGMTASGSLASMQDRFINTWPRLIEALRHEHLIWLGVGPGGFGSATGFYPSAFDFNVAYSDNLALYLSATFGVIGCALLTFVFVERVLARRAGDARIWLMLFFLLLSGVTTDIVEALGCLLFLGVTLNALAASDTPAEIRARPIGGSRGRQHRTSGA